MRASILLGSLVAAMSAGPAAAQPDMAVPVEPFHAVELRDGGHVTVRHGSAHQVVVREGNLEVSRIGVSDGRLLIERCRDHCPRGYRLEVEVTAPALDALAVRDGGRLQTSGAFQPQATLAAAVDSGGLLDARALAAEEVAASIQHGGGILVRPRRELAASISNGGLVTYFGDPRVTSAVSDGGAVARGEDADVERPLAELQPSPRPLPVVPPVPPLGKR